MRPILACAFFLAASGCAAPPSEEDGRTEAAASGEAFAPGIYDSEDGSAVVYRREGRTFLVMAASSGTCSGEIASQTFTVRASLADERTRCRLQIWPHVLTGGLGMHGTIGGGEIERTFVPRALGALDGVYRSAAPSGPSLEVTGSGKDLGPLQLTLGAGERTVDATARPRPLGGGHLQPTHFDVRADGCELVLVTSRARGAFLIRLTASADASEACRGLASAEPLRQAP